MRFFDPALELRRFLQVPRTEGQKTKKLAELALRVRKHPELTISVIPTDQGIIAAILEDYNRGGDILDPELFDREDIAEFALEYGIQNDPQVLASIAAAKPRKTS
jgi:hypothetical protein